MHTHSSRSAHGLLSGRCGVLAPLTSCALGSTPDARSWLASLAAPYGVRRCCWCCRCCCWGACSWRGRPALPPCRSCRRRCLCRLRLAALAHPIVGAPLLVADPLCGRRTGRHVRTACRAGRRPRGCSIAVPRPCLARAGPTSAPAAPCLIIVNKRALPCATTPTIVSFGVARVLHQLVSGSGPPAACSTRSGTRVCAHAHTHTLLTIPHTQSCTKAAQALAGQPPGTTTQPGPPQCAPYAYGSGGGSRLASMSCSSGVKMAHAARSSSRRTKCCWSPVLGARGAPVRACAYMSHAACVHVCAAPHPHPHPLQTRRHVHLPTYVVPPYLSCSPG